MKHFIKQGRHFKSDLLNIATCGIVSILIHISKKANNTLGFFRRNIKMHSKLLKSFLVRPQLYSRDTCFDATFVYILYRRDTCFDAHLFRRLFFVYTT